MDTRATGMRLSLFLAIVLVAGIAPAALFATGTPLTKAEYEEKMAPPFASANRESAEATQEIKPEKSVDNGVRAFRAQENTMNRLIDEFEEINPPSDIQDEHQDLIESYQEYVRVAGRITNDPDFVGSDSAQQALDSAMTRASVAESHIRDKGYKLGPPYF